MKICDICHQSSPEAKLIDNVIVGILKESQLQSALIGDILDQLKIKQTILDNKKPAYGDICEACQVKVAADVAKVVKDGVAAIGKSLAALLGDVKSNVTLQNSNVDWFNRVCSNSGFARSR